MTTSSSLLSVSGHDFIRAMLCEGYRLVGVAGSRALLTRGAVELWVSQRGELTEDEVLALLQAADVSLVAFIMLLNRLKSRETWPEQGEVMTLADASASCHDGDRTVACATLNEVAASERNSDR